MTLSSPPTLEQKIEERRAYSRAYWKMNGRAVNDKRTARYPSAPEEQKKARLEKAAERRRRLTEAERVENHAWSSAGGHGGGRKDKANKKRRQPAWLDREAAFRVYIAAAVMSELTGIAYVVDHAVPLISDRVCGFHCESNLKVITADENSRKSNRVWPGMWPLDWQSWLQSLDQSGLVDKNNKKDDSNDLARPRKPEA